MGVLYITRGNYPIHVIPTESFCLFTSVRRGNVGPLVAAAVTLLPLIDVKVFLVSPVCLSVCLLGSRLRRQVAVLGNSRDNNNRNANNIISLRR